MFVSSGGVEPSWWTLNHSTTVWPAYDVVSIVLLVHTCALELLLKIVARVAPPVVRIWASCQSNTQAAPVQASSAVVG